MPHSKQVGFTWLSPPIDYSENKRVLVDELKAKVAKNN
jgi:hypothetical protein